MDMAAIVLGSIGAAVSLIMLSFLIARGVFTLEHRLTKLETKIDPFWEGLTKLVADGLARAFAPKGNPIMPERWQYLTAKLQDNTLTIAEANELNTVLLEQQEVARQSDDLAKILLIGLGLLILASILKR